MSIIIGIDHGYYAIKTAHCSFPAGLTSYGEHEPYTRQGLLEFGGCFFVCGSGRQPIQRDKTVNDNYYLLTLAAIAKEIQQRSLPPECSVRIAAGLPLTSFGRDKPKFKDYLLRSNQPVNYKFEGVEYSITIEEVAIFPQGYAALMTETGLLQDEPSMLLMDLGGWTVDLMRIDNAIPAADTAHSLELGMIRCVDDIREQVRRETGLSLTDAQIENMLAGQPCTVSYIKDSFVSELCDLDRDLMLSIDILPVPTDEAARQLQSTLLGVETNVANWQRRQNANNNFTATIPYDMELQRKETKEMLDDLTTRDQRMMFGLVTLVHLADNKEQLDSDTETLYSTARKHLCQLSTLRWQQKDGLDTVLPYGLRKIQALRTLTTESTAVLIPFRAQEIMQPNGLYYGQNAVSKNMIVADRRLLLNGNSFRLGVSGSGKSMSAKEEIVQIALSTEDDILILDPESEFGYLTEALGGEVIRISATSDTHINALDMDRAYGDERNPIVSKSEFVLSLFEQLIGDGMVTAKEKSILGRCTEQVYLPYIRNGYKGTPPTLQDFYRLLQMQPEPEAQGLALASELFITGTLNTFAQRTNVDTNARIIDYDIRELGEQLMPLGMLVTLDAIYNRVIRNWKSGKTTWIFCDEFYVLFRYEYSANFFYKLWKRIRKYNGLITGLTQNVEELLRSDTARLMLANSEFLVLLNQSATDREELAKLLNISDTQLGYITNVPAGCGLIRCAGSIVPFTNSFPKNTRLYQLMTTKPDEALR